MNICVDDFSLAGQVELHQDFWEGLRKHIKIEPETKLEDGARWQKPHYSSQSESNNRYS